MILNNEIWKDVVGYEGLYQVSNLGRVKSVKRGCASKGLKERSVPSKILQQSLGRGYYYFNLSKSSKCSRVLAHRIVANAFIDNPHNYRYINHKDENKLNNNIDNLEWCTAKYNNNYGNRKQKSSITALKNKKNCRKVLHVSSDGSILKEYDGIKYAAIELGVSEKVISDILRGKLIKEREHLLFKYKTGSTWHNHKRI